MSILQQNKEMLFTPEDEEDEKTFNKSLFCHTCEDELNGDKGRDHCRITDKFLGASHNECNINRNNKNF